MAIKIIARNRKAHHDYHILDTYEAGIVLRGSEIKSIRAGQISIKEAFVRIDADRQEAWLENAHIAPYDPASRLNHEPLRPRKLLLHRREIGKLWDNVRRKSMTIIPLRVYLKNGRAKVEIALARGKRQYDKRAAIKARETEREIQRQLGRDW
jgi:SsrA-binding protein